MGGHGWVCWVDNEAVADNRSSGYVNGQLIELSRQQLSLCGSALLMDRDKIDEMNEDIVEVKMQMRCLSQVLKAFVFGFLLYVLLLVFAGETGAVDSAYVM